MNEQGGPQVHDGARERTAQTIRRGDRSGRELAQRIFDVVAAATVLVVTLPLLAIAVVALQLESPGAIVVGQTRWGPGGNAFTAYTLRTTTTNDGSQRNSRVGRVLHALSLDEIPVAWNVLRGDTRITELIDPASPMSTR